MTHPNMPLLSRYSPDVVGGVLRHPCQQWDVKFTFLLSCSILFDLLGVNKCLPTTSRHGLPPIQIRPYSAFSGQNIHLLTKRISAAEPNCSSKKILGFPSCKLEISQQGLDDSTEKRFHTLNKKISNENNLHDLEQSNNPISNGNNKTDDDIIQTKSSFMEYYNQSSPNFQVFSEQTAEPVPAATSHSNIAAGRDRKLPELTSLSVHMCQDSEVLTTKLLAIYHAMAHKTTSNILKEFWNNYNTEQKNIKNAPKQMKYYHCNEEDLTRSLKLSLKDAGFVLLTQRDWDLCEALNAGYLLRLTIQPDFKYLDPSLGSLFYPNTKEAARNLSHMVPGGPRVRRTSGHPKHTNLPSNCSVVTCQTNDDDAIEPLLFDGQVLVFRRGYSTEVTEGLLLLPKIDYIQTSVVQRSTATVVNFAIGILSSMASFFTTLITGISSFEIDLSTKKDNNIAGGIANTLSRYGGSKGSIYSNAHAFDRNYALSPFLAINGTEGGEIICQYDSMKNNTTPPLRLIQRVSISDLVEGRILKSFTSKSQLVEPTYDEVVVIWRPLSRKTAIRAKMALKIKKIAELFDVEDSLPSLPFTWQQGEEENVVESAGRRENKLPIEIRIFKGVQMSNLPAVFPRTKLIFRPADAFVNDLITVLTFLAVLASLKFESPKYDVIALLSFVTWLTRTLLRYRNTFARYDLLVKKFVTSKLIFRGSGALKYVVSEAGQQRAVRAGLIYNWILNYTGSSSFSTTKVEDGTAEDDAPTKGQTIISEHDIISFANVRINELVGETVDIDVVAALHDLEDMKLIERCTYPFNNSFIVISNATAWSSLKEQWTDLFDSY